ncbi:hypothetical protein DFJ73DRAFT_917010 [Zopfochytrium polystomum]|nr:hypothetical protein DFJ73DRAFT_917010 [Zopfochytrium polystomum]
MAAAAPLAAAAAAASAAHLLHHHHPSAAASPAAAASSLINSRPNPSPPSPEAPQAARLPGPHPLQLNQQQREQQQQQQQQHQQHRPLGPWPPPEEANVRGSPPPSPRAASAFAVTVAGDAPLSLFQKPGSGSTSDGIGASSGDDGVPTNVSEVLGSPSLASPTAAAAANGPNRYPSDPPFSLSLASFPTFSKTEPHQRQGLRLNPPSPASPSPPPSVTREPTPSLHSRTQQHLNPSREYFDLQQHHHLHQAQQQQQQQQQQPPTTAALALAAMNGDATFAAPARSGFRRGSASAGGSDYGARPSSGRRPSTPTSAVSLPRPEITPRRPSRETAPGTPSPPSSSVSPPRSSAGAFASSASSPSRTAVIQGGDNAVRIAVMDGPSTPVVAAAAPAFVLVPAAPPRRASASQPSPSTSTGTDARAPVGSSTNNPFVLPPIDVSTHHHRGAATHSSPTTGRGSSDIPTAEDDADDGISEPRGSFSSVFAPLREHRLEDSTEPGPSTLGFRRASPSGAGSHPPDDDSSSAVEGLAATPSLPQRSPRQHRYRQQQQQQRGSSPPLPDPTATGSEQHATPFQQQQPATQRRKFGFGSAAASSAGKRSKTKVPSVVAFEVELDDEDSTMFFEPSQGIQGRSVLELSRPTVIAAVRVQVQGIVAAGLGYSLMSASSAAKLTQPAPFATSQHLFLDSITLFPPEDSQLASLRLPAGKHVWPFSFRVPPVSALPPTYRGKVGTVKYEAVSTLERPTGLSAAADLPNVIAAAPIKRKVARREIPVRAIETREMRQAFENPLAMSIEAGAGSLWWRAGKVVVTARMPRSGFSFDEQIPVTFEITNHSANGVHLSDVAIEERTLCSFPDGSYWGPNVANRVPFSFAETFPPSVRTASRSFRITLPHLEPRTPHPIVDRPQRPSNTLVGRLRRGNATHPPANGPTSSAAAPAAEAPGSEPAVAEAAETDDSTHARDPGSVLANGAASSATEVRIELTEPLSESGAVGSAEADVAVAATSTAAPTPSSSSSSSPPTARPSPSPEADPALLPQGLNASFTSSLISVSHFLVASIKSTRRGSPSVVLEIPIVLVAIRRDRSLLRRAAELNAVVDDAENEAMRRPSLDTLPLYEPPVDNGATPMASPDADEAAEEDEEDDDDEDDEATGDVARQMDSAASRVFLTVRSSSLAENARAGASQLVGPSTGSVPANSAPANRTQTAAARLSSSDGLAAFSVGQMQSTALAEPARGRMNRLSGLSSSATVGVQTNGSQRSVSLNRSVRRRPLSQPPARGSSRGRVRFPSSNHNGPSNDAQSPSSLAHAMEARAGIRRYSWIGPTALPSPQQFSHDGADGLGGSGGSAGAGAGADAAADVVPIISLVPNMPSMARSATMPVHLERRGTASLWEDIEQGEDAIAETVEEEAGCAPVSVVVDVAATDVDEAEEDDVTGHERGRGTAAAAAAAVAAVAEVEDEAAESAGAAQVDRPGEEVVSQTGTEVASDVVAVAGDTGNRCLGEPSVAASTAAAATPTAQPQASHEFETLPPAYEPPPPGTAAAAGAGGGGIPLNPRTPARSVRSHTATEAGDRQNDVDAAPAGSSPGSGSGGSDRSSLDNVSTRTASAATGDSVALPTQSPPEYLPPGDVVVLSPYSAPTGQSSRRRGSVSTRGGGGGAGGGGDNSDGASIASVSSSVSSMLFRFRGLHRQNSAPVLSSPLAHSSAASNDFDDDDRSSPAGGDGGGGGGRRGPFRFGAGWLRGSGGGGGGGSGDAAGSSGNGDGAGRRPSLFRMLGRSGTPSPSETDGDGGGGDNVLSNAGGGGGGSSPTRTIDASTAGAGEEDGEASGGADSRSKAPRARLLQRPFSLQNLRWRGGSSGQPSSAQQTPPPHPRRADSPMDVIPIPRRIPLGLPPLPPGSSSSSTGYLPPLPPMGGPLTHQYNHHQAQQPPARPSSPLAAAAQTATAAASFSLSAAAAAAAVAAERRVSMVGGSSSSGGGGGGGGGNGGGGGGAAAFMALPFMLGGGGRKRAGGGGGSGARGRAVSPLWGGGGSSSSGGGAGGGDEGVDVDVDGDGGGEEDRVDNVTSDRNGDGCLAAAAAAAADRDDVIEAAAAAVPPPAAVPPGGVGAGQQQKDAVAGSRGWLRLSSRFKGGTTTELGK